MSYLYFKAVLVPCKTAGSAQGHKSISFIWIVWSTLYVYLWLFLKHLQLPFLRPLRSKDILCWILRLWTWNLVIISERLAANLEKVMQTSVWQTIPKFWFICLFLLFLKIQHRSSFDLNDLENGSSLHLKNNLKSMHLFQRLLGAMNCS